MHKEIDVLNMIFISIQDNISLALMLIKKLSMEMLNFLFWQLAPLYLRSLSYFGPFLVFTDGQFTLGGTKLWRHS